MANRAELLDIAKQAIAEGDEVTANAAMDAAEKLPQAAPTTIEPQNIPAGQNNSPAGQPDHNNTLQVYNPFGQNIDTGLNIGQTTSDVLAGTGRGMSNMARGIGQHLGYVSQQEIKDANKIDEPLLKTTGGKIGNVLGSAALLAPSMFIPGANTYGGAAAIGAGAGALEPVEDGNVLAGTAKNAALGGTLGAAGQGIGNALSFVGKNAHSLVKPLTRGGQDVLAGKALLNNAENPELLAGALASAPNEIIKNSPITTPMAAGDIQLAGLNRTLASNSPDYNSEMTRIMAQKNAAQHELLKDMAGSGGKLATAKSERNAASLPIMHEVLDRAGLVNSTPVIKQIDTLLSNPDNAGKTAQEALNQTRGQILKFTNDDGQIHARALYALRKDIDTIIGGKLQGDAGNLKNASSQLKNVKNYIDDAIDAGSKRSSSTEVAIRKNTGTEVAPMSYGDRVGAANDAETSTQGSWKNYLETYSEMSKPIEQMKIATQLYKRLQNGQMDVSGNLSLSAPALNKLLIQDGKKNLSQKIGETLTQDQQQTLKNIASDLNAGSLSMSAGRAVGSNTVQNLASSQLLGGILSDNVHPMLMPLKKATNLIYGGSNEQIMKKLESGMLNPEIAKKLLQSVDKDALTAKQLGKYGDLQRMLITSGFIAPAISQQ